MAKVRSLVAEAKKDLRRSLCLAMVVVHGPGRPAEPALIVKDITQEQG